MKNKLFFINKYSQKKMYQFSFFFNLYIMVYILYRPNTIDLQINATFIITVLYTHTHINTLTDTYVTNTPQRNMFVF